MTINYKCKLFVVGNSPYVSALIREQFVHVYNMDSVMRISDTGNKCFKFKGMEFRAIIFEREITFGNRNLLP